MPQLTFVTGNQQKFIPAQQTCQKYDIQLLRASPEIDEVQSEDGEYIARKKAESAYKSLKVPVVVSDDSWSIAELKGFPGAYMKSMNHWFTTEDFIRLTTTLQDRSVTLTQYLVYQDADQQVLITNAVHGTVLHEAKGVGDCPWVRIVTMEGDEGKSIAEIYDDTSGDRSTRRSASIWHDFALKIGKQIA